MLRCLWIFEQCIPQEIPNSDRKLQVPLLYAHTQVQQFVYVHKHNAISEKKRFTVIMHLKAISSLSLILLFQNSVLWGDDDS